MRRALLAYKKLKQSNYYDTVNLFLRHQIAEFEASADFQERLNNVQTVITNLEKNGFKRCGLLDEWIEAISFRCLPKSIKTDDPDNHDGSCFVSNIRTDEQYVVEGVNYFIEAPIELHILDIFWSMEVGVILEEDLLPSCLGNRLERIGEGENQHNTGRLFKIFHRQYSKWRDTAIKKAQKALENETSVLIIGLDIKQCYYHVETDFNRIDESILEDPFKKGLSKIIQKIGAKYQDILKSYLHVTNPTAESIQGLPVGLSSSHILANWMLSRFDKKVISKLNPLYYGRYVDDILIVLQALPSSKLNDCGSAVEELFLQNKLLSKDHENDFHLNCLPTLKIQPNKLIIQYFDATHSHAGLKEFSKEIIERASEFRFLPVGDDLHGLDDCAFDIIYKGSVNKIRSVVGMEENSTELSKYLSRRIIQYRLCKDGLDKEHLNQLFRFYQGRNIFDFCRLWEKVFTLLITNHKEFQCTKFHKQCSNVIAKIEAEASIQEKIKIDMGLYLNLSLAVPIGLMSSSFAINCKSRTLNKLLINSINNENISEIAKKFRQTNMIRHYFVSYPLLNYTSYDGDLVSPISDDLPLVDDWDINNKAQYTPRYIHHDELQLFALLQCLIQNDTQPEDYMEHFKKLCMDIKNQNGGPVDYRENDQYNVVHCPLERKGYDKKSVIVGIANIKVSEDDIELAYKPMRKQNLSYSRQSDLYSLLNSAIEKPKCDIVVFPELSIPFAWVPTMVSFARKHDVGLVFGVEHVIIHNNAHNLVFTLLPYKNGLKQKGCFISARLKNHYAPAEENTLRIHGLNAIKPKTPYYELFHWKGKAFSVFNCFELTNIAHRGFMRSELDFLVTVAWNKDINYYDHILTSTCRDLHCYIVHSNTSQFGDSRITAPKRQEEMDFLRVKGGISSVLLKEKLNIEELRDFQMKEYDPNDSTFKPTPAGYERAKIRKRAK
jgi:hypothetical protein